MTVKAHMSGGEWKVCKAVKQPCPLGDVAEHRYFENTQELNKVNVEIAEAKGKKDYGILPNVESNDNYKGKVDFSDEVQAQKFSDEFSRQYDFLYEADVNNQYVAGSNEALDYFDNSMTDEERETLVGYTKYRHDPVSSDREAVAFMFAIDNYED